ncbi:MAG: hypothetical protein V2I67_20285 [Thermoanaerobaculales bacterium]|nr:hypothetical protein [Thermoanaerobaculales bacterium]
MKRPIRTLTIFAITAAAAVAAVPVHAGEEDAQSVIGNDTCCFTNPRYTGVCKVTTGPDETCGDVLAYLNNQASAGKTYCGNTKIRGGWAQVSCEEASTSCVPAAADDIDQIE